MRGLPHALILDVRQVGVEVRLGLPPRANALQHHVPHRLLGLFPTAMPGHQVQPQVDGRGRAGTGDQVALVDEQVVHRRRGLGETSAKRIQHVPVHAHRTTADHARLRQGKGAGADAQQPRSTLRRALQPVTQGVGQMGIEVIVAAADRHVIEGFEVLRQAPGHLQRDPGTGGSRQAVHTHHPPRRMDLPAAAAEIGGQAQHIDKAGKRRQCELIQQDQAHRQLRTTACPGIGGVRLKAFSIELSHFWHDLTIQL
ncbi:hypothetical protein D3C84_806550 [compost metagenome]